MKAEIPCVDDSISKLEDIGEKTQKKLADIRAAAETCGALDFAFPEKSVITGWLSASTVTSFPTTT